MDAGVWRLWSLYRKEVGISNLSVMIAFGIDTMLIRLFRLTRFARQIATKYCRRFVCLDKKSYSRNWIESCAELTGLVPGLDRKVSILSSWTKRMSLVWDAYSRESYTETLQLRRHVWILCAQPKETDPPQKTSLQNINTSEIERL